MKLVTVAEMQEVEHDADANGVSYDQMMENAGLGLAAVVERELIANHKYRIVGLVGSGNNGGDALVALSSLEVSGWRTSAYIVKSRKNDDPLIQSYLASGGEVFQASDDITHEQISALILSADYVIDGVLGTGIKLPLQAEIEKSLAYIKSLVKENSNRIGVIAVDCPSGIDCDTGETSTETLPANITVAMAAVKSGLLRTPAYQISGSIHVVDIGLPEKLESWQKISRYVIDQEFVKSHLPGRPLDSHKGTYGTVFIIAGCTDYTGAAFLAGKAAYHSGTGLVKLGVTDIVHLALAGHIPEATWVVLPQKNGYLSAEGDEIISRNLGRVTALLIGPGIGTHIDTAELLNKLFCSEKIIPPSVIDADGLKLLSRINKWPDLIPENSVLTPHPGEFSILTGLDIEYIQENRSELAEKFSKEWGHTIILKGAFTVIASPDGQTGVIPVASSALARAGTGDVLAGLVVGLRAQGLNSFQSSAIGAWIHAQAGLLAAEKSGSTRCLLASDLINSVSSVIAKLGDADN